MKIAVAGTGKAFLMVNNSTSVEYEVIFDKINLSLQ